MFKFTATFDMAPSLDVIVYRLKKGELLSAKTNIELKVDLNNFVKLKLSTQQTSPGQNITIDVTTNPKSYVGLLGIDQSVLILKKNDGLTKEDAFNELGSYDSTHYPTESSWGFKDARYYGSDYNWNSVIMLTNAKRPDEEMKVYDSYPVQSSALEYDRLGVEISYTADEEIEQSSLTPNIRKEFPETWLWEEISTDR